MGELRTQFHQKMDEIGTKVIQLFATVGEDLAQATEAFLAGDSEIVETLATRESAIDDLYKDIEAQVNLQLALESPVAADLRFLLSVLRIVPELERSHDLIVHIAGYADYTFSQELTPRARGLVDSMGKIGAEMWRDAADSWFRRDPAVAESLDERDDEIDTLHAALTVELSKGEMPTPMIIAMTLVGRFYERLGDHAVNIARRVVYLAGATSSPA